MKRLGQTEREQCVSLDFKQLSGLLCLWKFWVSFRLTEVRSLSIR